MNWLNNTKIRILNPADIDLEDESRRFPCFSSLGPLEESIAKIGMVNPPVAYEAAEGAIVPVLGTRRLTAARNLGLATVEIRVLEEELTRAEAFRMAFWDNAAHRVFDQASVAVIVRRLLELFPRDVVAREFLPALGVPPEGPRIERLRAIGSLAPAILTALAHGRILEKTAWTLSEMDPEDRTRLLEITESLGLNANKKAEVIESLFDLSVFHGKPVLEFLEHESARAALADEAPARGERFREVVREWKFPQLTEKQKQFQERVRSWGCPPHVVARPTKNFEGRDVIIEARCRSLDEAELVVRRLKGPVSSEQS